METENWKIMEVWEFWSRSVFEIERWDFNNFKILEIFQFGLLNSERGLFAFC
jgi:hypothetical protein